MQINFILWEYFINFLEIFLFYIFIQAKLHLIEDCKYIRTKQFIYLILRLFIVCTLNMVDLSTIVTISTSCFLEIIFALLFYNDAFVMRIFWGSMYSVICLISEYITVFVPQTFSNVTSPELLYGGALRMPFTLLYIALIAGLIFLFHCISNKNIQLSTMQKVSYLMILIAGILIGHYIMIITIEAQAQFHDSEFTSRLVLVNLVFLVLFLFLLLYIYQLGYSNAVNTTLLEQQRMHELEEMEYKTVSASKHDVMISN